MRYSDRFFLSLIKGLIITKHENAGNGEGSEWKSGDELFDAKEEHGDNTEGRNVKEEPKC